MIARLLRGVDSRPSLAAVARTGVRSAVDRRGVFAPAGH